MSSIDLAAVSLASAIALALAACGSVSEQREVTCGAQPVEVLPNGSFEADTPAWTPNPAGAKLLCDKTVITPADGAKVACLGSTDGTTHTLTQTVPLPGGAKTARLSGKICIATTETAAADHDVLTFDLLDGDTVIAPLGKATNQMGKPSCAFADFERTAALTGDPQTATLRIRSTLDTEMPTGFYLDALSLTISCSP